MGKPITCGAEHPLASLVLCTLSAEHSGEQHEGGGHTWPVHSCVTAPLALCAACALLAMTAPAEGEETVTELVCTACPFSARSQRAVSLHRKFHGGAVLELERRMPPCRCGRAMAGFASCVACGLIRQSCKCPPLTFAESTLSLLDKARAMESAETLEDGLLLLIVTMVVGGRLSAHAAALARRNGNPSLRVLAVVLEEFGSAFDTSELRMLLAALPKIRGVARG